MTPMDIVKVLSAAAPIVASVASAARPEQTIIQRKEDLEPKVVNNSISITNNFYVKSEGEAQNIASDIQSKMLESFSSGDRFKL